MLVHSDQHETSVKFHSASLQRTIIIVIIILFRLRGTVFPLLSIFATYQVQDNIICKGNTYEQSRII